MVTTMTEGGIKSVAYTNDTRNIRFPVILPELVEVSSYVQIRDVWISGDLHKLRTFTGKVHD